MSLSKSKKDSNSEASHSRTHLSPVVMSSNTSVAHYFGYSNGGQGNPLVWKICHQTQQADYQHDELTMTQFPCGTFWVTLPCCLNCVEISLAWYPSILYRLRLFFLHIITTRTLTRFCHHASSLSSSVCLLTVDEWAFSITFQLTPSFAETKPHAEFCSHFKTTSFSPLGAIKASVFDLAMNKIQ